MYKRIIIRLTGGIGNQLFQYAFARALSLQESRHLIIDNRSYRLKNERQLGRNYALDQFNISFSKPKLIDQCYIILINTRFINRILRYLSKSYIREEYFSNVKLKNSHNRLYLEGYWQSYKDFEKYKEVIRRELTFKNCIDDEPLAKMIKFSSNNSVMLHIRRGDYLNDPNHHVLNFNYYKNAVNYIISQNNKNLSIFVFTDDPVWARQNVEFEGIQVIIADDYRDDPNLDLQLMSLCHHHILANSTFSWWSRYLSSEKGLCIVPKEWHIPGSNKNISGLLPAHWIIL